MPTQKQWTRFGGKPSSRRDSDMQQLDLLLWGKVTGMFLLLAFTGLDYERYGRHAYRTEQPWVGRGPIRQASTNNLIINAPMNPNKALWEKGDFTRIAKSMRESGEALV